jgi:cytochrome d ubiquinol oxidase subunit I
MAQHQLPKIEAMEGNWQTDNNGYNLIVVPDTDNGTDRFRLEIPHLGAVIAHDLTGQSPVPGLLMTPAADRPNMWAAFYGFRAMYFTALAMFATAFVGLVLRLRGRMFASGRFLKWMVWMTPAGLVAITGGWITAETGRQPWVVYGKIRTADAVSHLSTFEAAASLIGFVALYSTLLVIWAVYIVRTVKAGPEALAIEAPNPSTEPEASHA